MNDNHRTLQNWVSAVASRIAMGEPVDIVERHLYDQALDFLASQGERRAEVPTYSFSWEPYV